MSTDQGISRISSHRFTKASERQLSGLHLLSCYLGGILTQIAWFVLLLGSAMSWGMVPNADLTFLKFMGQEILYSEATIKESIKTRVSEGGGEDEPGEPIYENRFYFEINGQPYEGTSYSVGNLLTPGTKVDIEYPASDPRIARIEGMRANMFSPIALLILVLPSVGILLLFLASRRAGRIVNLLRNGKVSLATIAEVEPTNVRINDRTVCRYTLVFNDEFDVPHRTQFSTHRDDLFSNSQEEKKKVLYHPDNPTNAVLVDLLPSGIRFDSSDRPLSGTLPMIKILFPLATLVVNCVGFYKVFI